MDDLEKDIEAWKEAYDRERSLCLCATTQEADAHTLLTRCLDAIAWMPKWTTVEEFQKEPNEGWCWIVYKGRVVEAYHDHEQVFGFHRLSQNCYMTECISAVMPWPLPITPKGED